MLLCFPPAPTASANVCLSHSAACCSAYLCLFSWRQSNHCRGRNDRQQNNWGTGTLWTVSLQPIIITRGQAECPFPMDRWGVVDPAQGLAYSYPINMHTLQTKEMSAARKCTDVWHEGSLFVQCRTNGDENNSLKGKTEKGRKKDVGSRSITCCYMNDSHMMLMVIFQLLWRSEE